MFSMTSGSSKPMDELLGRTPYSSGIRAVPRGTYPPVNVGATPAQVDV